MWLSPSPIPQWGVEALERNRRTATTGARACHLGVGLRVGRKSLRKIPGEQIRLRLDSLEAKGKDVRFTEPGCTRARMCDEVGEHHPGAVCSETIGAHAGIVAIARAGRVVE